MTKQREVIEHKEFMRGYIMCLSNVSRGGRDTADTYVREAWMALGDPKISEIKKLGLSDFDIEACRKIKKGCK